MTDMEADSKVSHIAVVICCMARPDLERRRLSRHWLDR